MSFKKKVGWKRYVVILIGTTAAVKQQMSNHRRENTFGRQLAVYISSEVVIIALHK